MAISPPLLKASGLALEEEMRIKPLLPSIVTIGGWAGSMERALPKPTSMTARVRGS